MCKIKCFYFRLIIADATLAPPDIIAATMTGASFSSGAEDENESVGFIFCI